jgi:thiol:disulfide interchange protein DsbD
MKRLLLICCGLLLALGLRAQGPRDPSTWTLKALPGNGAYDLVFHVSLPAGWHIWTLDAGGDGMLIATAATFEKGSHKLVGGLRETGKLVETEMEGIEGKVRYFSGEADFIQTVQAKSGDIVKGEYTYQLCNESMCLPPKTIPFSFTIP